MDKKDRNASRRAVLWAGHVEFGEYNFTCQIWNISLGGAKLNIGVPLALGTKVTLVLDKYGRFIGEIVWQEGKNIGIKFDSDPETIRKTLGEDAIHILGLDEPSKATSS
jgi:PilZ domain